jgi:hypothetical protein
VQVLGPLIEQFLSALVLQTRTVSWLATSSYSMLQSLKVKEMINFVVPWNVKLLTGSLLVNLLQFINEFDCHILTKDLLVTKALTMIKLNSLIHREKLCYSLTLGIQVGLGIRRLVICVFNLLTKKQGKNMHNISQAGFSLFFLYISNNV